MPAMRESLMTEAFPVITKQFEQAVEQPPRWRALLEALGTRVVADTARQVRIVNVKTSQIPVAGQAHGTTIEETTGKVLPHIRIRTVRVLHWNDLAGIRRPSAAVLARVTALADAAVKTGNLVLFKKVRPFDSKGKASCTLDDLPDELERARRALNGHGLSLLVSGTRYLALTGEDELAKKIVRELRGGVVAPVVALGDSDAYVLRHGAGDIVVEVVHALQPFWDLGPGGSVELIALEEFVAVTEKQPPAYELTLT